MNKHRKIKNLIINPAYQIRYIFWLTGSGLLLVVLNTLVFYSKVRENYQFLVEMSPMTDEAKTLLFKELNQIAWIILGSSFLFLILVGVLGLILSHRTAGPLYHFQKVFNDIKNGKLKARIRLRPKDDFQGVAQSFNEMMDQLEQKVEKR